MSVPGRTVSVALTPQMAEALGRLTQTGFHGRTRAEVARRLLAAALLERYADLPRVLNSCSHERGPAE